MFIALEENKMNWTFISENFSPVVPCKILIRLILLFYLFYFFKER